MSRSRVGRQRPRRLVLFLFVYMILLFHISGYVGNEMATATLSVSMAIVEEGRLTIDSYIDGARELSYHEGHFYSGMPPGQSFIATPLYFAIRPALSVIADKVVPRLEQVNAAGQYHLDREFAVRRLLLLIVFTALLAAPCAAATCLMVVDIAGAPGERIGTLGALLLPLCTIWWTYGTDYGPRVMGGFLLLLPIWWVFVRREAAPERTRTAMAAIMGAGLALTPLIRYELVFPAAVIGLWLLFHIKGRRAVVLLIAAVAVAGTGMAYHNHCYGAPTAVAYSKKIWPVDALPREYRHQARSQMTIRYDGTDWTVWDQRSLVSFTPGVIASGLWDNREALVRFSPFLILVPAGAVVLLRRRRQRARGILLSGLFILSLVVLALMPHPGFRGAIGPRYLLWGVPVLVLLALPAWERLPRSARWPLFIASFAPSYLAAMLGSHTDGAWSFYQLAEFGLTNYTLSRAQQAGIIASPLASTLIVLAFWAVVAIIFLRSGSRWSIANSTDEGDEAAHTDQHRSAASE